MHRPETIAAISTPRGEGGIGIVRISGPAALSIARRVFVTPRGALPDPLTSHTVHYGFVLHPLTGARADEVLLLYLRAPRTYTGEDVVELQGHGGAAATSAVLEAVFAAGARAADPGEFTRRAFLHGRLDLSQAEAVIEVVRARTNAGREAALACLAGAFSGPIGALQERLLDLLVVAEAALDTDEGEDIPPPRLGDGMDAIAGALRDLAARSGQGALYQEGVTVSIAGRPNVGKSSLLNALLEEERAIVTPHPGTTRDSVEGWINLGDIPLRLVDGAGIRESACAIEQEGVRRAVEQVHRAPLVIVVLDASAPLGPDDRAVLDLARAKPLLLVLNKIDLPVLLDPASLRAEFPNTPVVEVSCLQGRGVREVRGILCRLIAPGLDPPGHSTLAANPRQREVLQRAAAHLDAAREAARNGYTLDAVAADLRLAREALGEITGATGGADLLDRIFSRFCIGK